MDILQIWGGLFYLLQKVGLSVAEGAKNKALARRLRITAWAIYIAGLPPWLVILTQQRNWIAASVEASGFPAMVLGLVFAIEDKRKDPPMWLNIVALIGVLTGLRYSFYDFGGITIINQWLEIVLSVGYLVGTYLLALKKPAGYLWYIPMHVACAWLMWMEGMPWLFWAQVISLVFILSAYRTARNTVAKSE